MMQRRRVLRGGGALGVWAGLGSPTLTAWAHHGWSSFDQTRPLYLEGTAVQVQWRNPHVELTLQVRQPLRLPPDLAQRPLPAQVAPVDGAALLARTALPHRTDAQWQIELAPLSRMNQWRVPEITPGTALAVVGFTFTGERGAPVLRAEYLFLGEHIYGMRSAPA